MAQSGNRVLIVDGNLRNPSLHRIFSLANSMGLTNILYTKSSYKNFICTTGIKNLDMLMCGPKPPNPSEMLNFTGVREIFGEIKNDYDYIFIDTAAIVGITDGMLLSSVCDGTILVLVLGETSSDDAFKAIELLRNVDACVLGIVMNKCRQGAKKVYPVSFREKGAAEVRRGLLRRQI
jgi:capsular exopolysaccharide synthesis family protein